MLKNIILYFNKIKLVLPGNLKKKLFYLYLALLVSASLEMLSLGSIPIFISFLIDPEKTFSIFGMDVGLSIKGFFPNSEIYIILPIIIILIFLIKSLYMFLVLFMEQSIIKDIKLYFVNNIFFPDSKVAARIGKEAFLEPEILICPLSFDTPKTSNFFMITLLVELLRFDPCICLYDLHRKCLEPDLLLKIKIEQLLHLHIF